MSENPSTGIVLLQKFGLLKNIIPELEEGIGCEQLGEHIFDVWNHLLHALSHAAFKKWPLEIRLSALFHDIGKPRTRRTDPRWSNVKGQMSNVFPMISLIVSGGHTMLVLMKDIKHYQLLGETVDDAAGEAFDKVAAILHLGFPGGPAVEREAASLHGDGCCGHQ